LRNPLQYIVKHVNKSSRVASSRQLTKIWDNIQSYINYI